MFTLDILYSPSSLSFATQMPIAATNVHAEIPHRDLIRHILRWLIYDNAKLISWNWL